MSTCLLSLIASLPGIIVICGLIALYCIVLFDTTPARGQMKTFRVPGEIEYYVCNVTAKPKTRQDDFDTSDILVKVDKITPHCNACLDILDILPKDQSMPCTLQEVDPSGKVWQVQVMTDAQENRCSDEQSHVLNFRSLQNTFWVFLEMISGTSPKTTISKNRKYK